MLLKDYEERLRLKDKIIEIKEILSYKEMYKLSKRVKELEENQTMIMKIKDKESVLINN